MASFNSTTLVGRLTRDPEMRYTAGGIPVANFTLAVDRYVSKDKEKITDFINCVTWGKLAEVCGQYLEKGKLILVQGQIQVESYIGKDGTKKYSTKVNVREMQMLGSKQDATGDSKRESSDNKQGISNPPETEDQNFELEDIPF